MMACLIRVVDHLKVTATFATCNLNNINSYLSIDNLRPTTSNINDLKVLAISYLLNIVARYARVSSVDYTCVTGSNGATGQATSTRTMGDVR